MYYRARYYDTGTGRFLSRDPLGVDPAGGDNNPFYPRKQYMDGSNLYEYVGSNPVIRRDYKGLGWGDGEKGCKKECKKKFKNELDTAEWIYDSAMAGCDAGLNLCLKGCDKIPDCDEKGKIAKKSCIFLCQTAHGACVTAAYGVYLEAKAGAAFNYGVCMGACSILW